MGTRREVEPARTKPETAKQRLGRIGEEHAVQHLESTGYRVVARNWRCRYGEIDIVATRNGIIAFVEVKTRSSVAFGHPFEAITEAKLRRMHLLARLWCAANSWGGAQPRLDVLGIVAPGGTVQHVQHLEGVYA